MADDASRLLSLLSHELRGPLGVIRGYLRLLIQAGDPLSDRARQAIEAATRASDCLAEILDEASMLAHLQRGGVTFDRKPVKLMAIVEVAIRAAGLPDESTNDAAIASDVTIDADSARLQSAIASFITATARAQPGPLLIAVRDASVRIAPRCGPSEAAETELNTMRGGMGLAIPVAAAIVAAHGGHVRELRDAERNAGYIVTLPVLRS